MQSLLTPEQADAAEIIEVSDDEQYALVVTLESPALAQSFESITHWVDHGGNWHSDLVYWWLAELQTDGRYHAFEWCGTCEEVAQDLWTLYAEGADAKAVTPLWAVQDTITSIARRMSGRAS